MSPTGKGPLRIAIDDWLKDLDLRDFVWKPVKHSIEQLENEALEYYESLYARFPYKEVIPDLFKPNQIRNDLPRRPIQIIPILISIGMMLLGLIIGAFQPLQRIGAYKIDRLVKSGRPSPLESILMAWRLYGHNAKPTPALEDLGLSEDFINGYMALAQQKLTAFEYLTLKVRGKLSDQDFFQELSKLGYTTETINQLVKLADQIPGVSDITRMAVRDAWNIDTVTRFGYDEGFPPEFGEWLSKIGYNPDWANKYWRAHWELPGVQQAFEMFQRLRPGRTANAFTENDLDVYLKAADIPAYFRDRLTEIAYAPLTRVDIRRMFGVGTLNADQVYQAYRDIGYDDKNAKLLTDFTTRIEKAEEKGLTRGAMQDAYQSGLWNRQQTIDALKEIGYSDEDADFWLDLVDIALQKQVTDYRLSAIKTQYINGTLDDISVYPKINALNLPSERVTALLEVWTAERNARVNIPSRSELDDFYRRDIIDDSQYREYLKRDGYQSKEIELFVTRIDQIKAADTTAELANQQAEQERLDKASKATDYQKKVADINVQIAENNAAIADIKLSIHDMENPDDIQAAKSGIDYLKLQNAELNIAKAVARQELIKQ